MLESFDLLDEARGLWRPLLILTHTGVMLAAVTTVLPQVMYARTIDAVTVITD